MYARDPTPGEGDWPERIYGHLAADPANDPDPSEADDEDTVPEYPLPEDMFRYSDPDG